MLFHHSKQPGKNHLWYLTGLCFYGFCFSSLHIYLPLTTPSRGLLFFSHLFSAYLSYCLLNIATMSTCCNCWNFRNTFLVLTSHNSFQVKVLALLNLINSTGAPQVKPTQQFPVCITSPDHSRSFYQKNVSLKEQLSIFYGMLIGPHMPYVYCKTLSPADIQPNLLTLEKKNLA